MVSVIIGVDIEVIKEGINSFYPDSMVNHCGDSVSSLPFEGLPGKAGQPQGRSGYCPCCIVGEFCIVSTS